VIEALCIAIANTEQVTSPADGVRALLVRSSMTERLGARA
jgi:hypothetical protein